MSTSPTPAAYTNPSARTWTTPTPPPSPAILRFHQTLPAYATTPLISLPSLAASLTLRSLRVKDESHRFGLPAYKIAGASWGVYRAVSAHLGVAADMSLQELGRLAQERNVSLVACSDGNWGRAVGRMARYLGVPATVLVPEGIDAGTRGRIAGEGARCEVCGGEYDDAVLAARALAGGTEGAVLVMDMAWEGYTEVPQWVTEGYSTLLAEVDAVLPSPGVVVVSVGVGSWAQAVVQHYKRESAERAAPTLIVAVEPEVAASLLTSLHAGAIESIRTGDSIMCGMNCGTTSDNAWPFLRDGIDAAVTVSELEAHEAVLELKRQEDGEESVRWDGTEGMKPASRRMTIDPGPCGAATLAALKKVIRERLLGDSLRDADVVLFSTEGQRDYVIPGT